jgi:hypothetical protein
MTAPTESRSRFSASPKVFAGKLDHLALHDVAQPVDAGDAVGQGNDRALGAGLDADVEALDLLLE